MINTNGRHLKLIRLPAAAETDDYAQSLGFVHDASAKAYVLDDAGRIALEKSIYL